MGWWVAQLQPNRSALACGCLARLGYGTYFPRTREHRQSYGRRTEVEAPLFPGYLFVLIAATGQWHAANVAPGVRHIVRTGLTPATVSDEVIADIRRREHAGLVMLPERQLQPGAPIRVITGPLSGLNGLCADMNGHQRIGVLLEFLGSERRLELHRDHVEVVDGG